MVTFVIPMLYYSIVYTGWLHMVTFVIPMLYYSIVYTGWLHMVTFVIPMLYHHFEQHCCDNDQKTWSFQSHVVTIKR